VSRQESPPADPRVAVVIVHYRRPTLLRATLEALAAQTLRPQQVTVVDNGDGSDCADLAEEYGARLVVMNRNAGYAAAANAGVACRPRDADALLIMSHECVLAPTALAQLSSTLASDPTIGAVGPLLGYLDTPDRVWSAGGGVGRRSGRPFHLLNAMSMSDSQHTGAVDVAWLDGACLLVRAEAADATGPMGEWWFLYVEELDWLTRMHQAGWRIVCDRAATARQEPGMTPPYLEARNLSRLFAQRKQVVHMLLLVIDQMYVSIRSLCTGSGWEATARMVGWWHGITGRLDLGRVDQRRSTSRP
jgi:GT2 family glycosyltransferase